MSDQPEALRLADRLDLWGDQGDLLEAAAELHRLHAENERLRQINQSHEMKLSVRGYEIQIADLEAQRDALKAAAEKGTEYVLAHINQDLRAEIEKANACIRKVEVEREKVAQWMIQRSYATGHGDNTEDLLNELEWQVKEREREACARLCEKMETYGDPVQCWLDQCAAAIRARGET